MISEPRVFQIKFERVIKVLDERILSCQTRSINDESGDRPVDDICKFYCLLLTKK